MTHYRFHTRLSLTACAFAGLVATQGHADTLWLGGETLFRLQASGSSRSLIVERPSDVAAAQGVTAGMVVFQGKRDGAVYVGTFTDPSAECDGGGVAVQGRVINELDVVLEPQAATGCTGLLGEALELRFVETAATEAAAPAEPVAEVASVEAEPAAEVEPAAEAEPEAEAEVVTEAEPMAEPEPVVEAEPEAEVEAVEVVSATRDDAPMAAGLMGGSFWQAGDLVLRLTASGTGRQLTVARAPEGSGLTEGMILFQGRRDGQTYQGVAFDPLADCDGVPEMAAQGVIEGETKVTLRVAGLPDCASDLFRKGMVLAFLGKAEGEAPDVAAATPAPVAEAEAEAEVPEAEEVPVAEAEMAETTEAEPMSEPVAEAVVEDSVAEADAVDAEAEAATELAAEDAPEDVVADAEAEAEVAPAKAAEAWKIPNAACVSKGAAQGLTIDACQGMLAGLRLAEGANPAAEADRRAMLSLARGATDLNRAVDTACYAEGAQVRDHEAGLVLAQKNARVTEGLRPLCLEMIASANKVPADARLATVATAAGAIAGEVWTLDSSGGSCRGKDVLRLTELGLFQGRYGSENTVTNSTVSEWMDDGARLSARITIHSEILTAPDVILQIAAERGDGGLRLTIDRQRVTPQSRYSNAPQYETDVISGTYFACKG